MSERIKITIGIVRPTSEEPNGYIGATASYPPRSGEDWRRGRDLADGPCNETTLHRIMEDVRAVMEGFGTAYERDRT